MGRQSSEPQGRQSVLKFQNSYRLESSRPYNREKCEKILKLVVDKALKEFEYDSALAFQLCETICEDIKKKVKLLEFERYRIIVTVTIGEKFMQSFENTVQFLWDPEKDGFVKYTYDTPFFYAIATLYALYFE